MKTKRIPGLSGKAFDKAIEDLGNTVSETGWFSSSKYEDGTPVAEVASIQEFGKAEPPAIPPRLGMRTTIKEQRPRWARKMELDAKSLLRGQTTAHDVLENVAVMALGDFKKTISKVTQPPLSMVTVLARKQRKETGNRATGKDVRQIRKDLAFVGPRGRKDKTTDISGVSIKPLIDTSYMFDTMTTLVRKK